jgi:hypothetical protein
VIVRAQGRTHEFSATSERDIPSGQVVQITGLAGSALIVTPIGASGSSEAGAAGEAGGKDRA